MVDIHSHILPGWDDGSKSLEESLAMLRIAVESGTRAIVATPHANSDFPFRSDTVNQLFSQLKEAANGIIDLHLGSDFHIEFENVQDALAHPTKYTIDHGAYLMVELPDVMNVAIIRDILNRLRDAGMVTVITHPERNQQMQTQIAELRRWVEEGALLQVTGQSLLGRFGRSAQQCANALLKEDLVHFIASDAHDTRDRTPDLSGAYRWMQSKFGKERAERLFKTNPADLLRGETVQSEADAAGQAQKSWWAFWK